MQNLDEFDIEILKQLDKDGRKAFSVIATEIGICRFDGYRFERFPGPDEINAVSVFCPMADPQGRVWFRTIADKLYFIENDSIRHWQWNLLFEKYKGNHLVSTAFSFFEKNRASASFMPDPLRLATAQDGQVQTLARPSKCPTSLKKMRTCAIGFLRTSFLFM